MMKSVLACVCVCLCSPSSLQLSFIKLFMSYSSLQAHKNVIVYTSSWFSLWISLLLEGLLHLFFCFWCSLLFTQKPHICCHQMYFELACKIQVFCAYNSMASTYHLPARSPLHTHAPPPMHACLYNVHLCPSTPCAHLHSCAHTPRTRTPKGKEH